MSVSGLTLITGIQGPQGSTGPQGLQGISGSMGPQGIQGIQGIQGESGLQGSQGISGSIGLTGPKGDPGTPADSVEVIASGAAAGAAAGALSGAAAGSIAGASAGATAGTAAAEAAIAETAPGTALNVRYFSATDVIGPKQICAAILQVKNDTGVNVHSLDQTGFYINNKGISVIPSGTNNPVFNVDEQGDVTGTSFTSPKFTATTSITSPQITASTSLTTPKITASTSITCPLFISPIVVRDTNNEYQLTVDTNGISLGRFGLNDYHSLIVGANGLTATKITLAEDTNVTGLLKHTNTQAILCQTPAPAVNQSGFYFVNDAMTTLTMKMIANSSNTHTGIADASFIFSSNNSAIENKGNLVLSTDNFYHTGSKSFLAYQTGSFIAALNGNTNDNKNQMSLIFKANKDNPETCDASILVTAGNYAIGGLETGSMFINAGSVLSMGSKCPDIRIGANVNYLNSTGAFSGNTITLGNAYTTVNVLGQLVLRSSGVNASGIILQNVNGHLRQFKKNI